MEQNNSNMYGKVVLRNVPVRAVRGASGQEVIGKVLFNGNRMTVFFPSRRVVQPGDVYPWDLTFVGRFLKAGAVDRDEATCPAPVRKPGYWKVTDSNLLEQARMADREGRPRYYFAETGQLCYLAADLEGHLGVINQARPVYVVATKYPYCFLVGDEDVIELVEYFEAEEDGRLPDLTLMLLGKLKVYNLQHDQLRVVGQDVFDKSGKKTGWTPFVDKTVEELLGVVDENGQPRVRWIPSSIEEIQAYHDQALAAYAVYTDDYLEGLLNNPCSEGEIRLIRQARDHDPKKLKQAKLLLEMRFRRHQRSLVASRETAGKNAMAVLEARKGGMTPKAPPVVRELAGPVREGRALVAKSPETMREEWVRLVEGAFPDTDTTEKVDGYTLSEWGGYLFSAAASLSMPDMLLLDEDLNLVLPVFDGAEFPRAYRWRVYAAVRKAQGIEESKIPIGHKLALEAEAPLSDEDLAAITAPEAANALISPWEGLLNANAVDDRRLRETIAAGLATIFGGLPAIAKGMTPEERTDAIKRAYECISLPLRATTRTKLENALAGT